MKAGEDAHAQNNTSDRHALTQNNTFNGQYNAAALKRTT